MISFYFYSRQHLVFSRNPNLQIFLLISRILKAPKKLLPRNKKYLSWFSLRIYSNPSLICNKKNSFWEMRTFANEAFLEIDSTEQFVSSSFAHFGLFINGFRSPFSDKNWLSFNEFRCFWVNWVTILFLDASFDFNLNFHFLLSNETDRDWKKVQLHLKTHCSFFQ